jgi:hypothetical protein
MADERTSEAEKTLAPLTVKAEDSDHPKCLCVFRFLTTDKSTLELRA